MSLTPAKDKLAIYRAISNDKLITETYGFTEILRTKDIAALFDKTKRYIMIYEKPSESTVNRQVQLSVYQIDLLTDNSGVASSSADLCQERCQELLDNLMIAPTKELHFLASVGNVSTSPSQYQIGMQFGVYAISNFTK